MFLKVFHDFSMLFQPEVLLLRGRAVLHGLPHLLDLRLRSMCIDFQGTFQSREGFQLREGSSAAWNVVFLEKNQ